MVAILGPTAAFVRRLWTENPPFIICVPPLRGVSFWDLGLISRASSEQVSEAIGGVELSRGCLLVLIDCGYAVSRSKVCLFMVASEAPADLDKRRWELCTALGRLRASVNVARRSWYRRCRRRAVPVAMVVSLLCH
jgi:hypothetical protein